MPRWFDGTEKSNKIKRRVMGRHNNLKIADIRNVMPTAGEVFYLRLLMKHLLARSFDAYLEHTFSGDGAPTQFATFHDADKAHGLVVDDNEAVLAMHEIEQLGGLPSQMRNDSVMLLMNLPTDAWALFVTHMDHMIADFAHRDGVDDHQLFLADGDASEIPLEQRRPLTALSKYNRLLLDINERPQRMGRENVNFGVPEPLALANARAATQLEKHLATYCDDATRQEYKQMLQQRIPTFPKNSTLHFSSCTSACGTNR